MSHVRASAKQQACQLVLSSVIVPLGIHMQEVCQLVTSSTYHANYYHMYNFVDNLWITQQPVDIL